MENKKRYFSFNNAAYYALIVAEDIKDAVDLYVKYIAYDSVDELHKESAYPIELTMQEAFYVFANECMVDNVEQLLKEFGECENSCLIIDRALL